LSYIQRFSGLRLAPPKPAGLRRKDDGDYLDSGLRRNDVYELPLSPSLIKKGNSVAIGDRKKRFRRFLS
jgi:hypothetical protein